MSEIIVAILCPFSKGVYLKRAVNFQGYVQSGAKVRAYLKWKGVWMFLLYCYTFNWCPPLHISLQERMSTYYLRWLPVTLIQLRCLGWRLSWLLHQLLSAIYRPVSYLLPPSITLRFPHKKRFLIHRAQFSSSFKKLK